jgi:hypothetical protein
MELREELSHVERLVKELSREETAAEKALRRERKDVDAARYPAQMRTWRQDPPDPDLIEREIAEARQAEDALSIATELVRIARARVDTLHARIAAGATTSEDNVALAHELRERLDVVTAAATDAQRNAIHSAFAAEQTTDARFTRAKRELGRARVQLALVIAGADVSTRSRLSAIDLDVTARVPDERWRQEVVARCRAIAEALVPVFAASAYR